MSSSLCQKYVCSRPPCLFVFLREPSHRYVYFFNKHRFKSLNDTKLLTWTNEVAPYKDRHEFTGITRYTFECVSTAQV